MSITAVPLRPLKKGAVAKVWLGIGAAVLIAAGAAYAGTTRTVAVSGTNEQFLAYNGGKAGVVTTPSGLQYQVLTPGSGPKPTDADLTLVNYRGTLRDGTVFDENQRAPLPVAGVVPGFSEGLKLMNKGAKYRFWIPPQLAYGSQAQGPIPADALLVFDVELLDFRSQAEIQAQMQAMQGAQGGAQPQPVEPQLSR